MKSVFLLIGIIRLIVGLFNFANFNISKAN